MDLGAKIGTTLHYRRAPMTIVKDSLVCLILTAVHVGVLGKWNLLQEYSNISWLHQCNQQACSFCCPWYTGGLWDIYREQRHTTVNTLGTCGRRTVIILRHTGKICKRTAWVIEWNGRRDRLQSPCFREMLPKSLTP